MPITKAFKKRNKILIISSSSPREIEVQSSLVNQLKNLREKILNAPVVEGIRFKNLVSDKRCEELKVFCFHLKSCVAVIQHYEDEIFDLENYIQFFDSHFDCVIRLRSDDSLTYCDLYEGKSILKLVQTLEF